MQSESQENSIKIYRRGDASPVDSGLVFFRYKYGREVWVTHEQFDHSRELKKAVQAKQRAKPEHKEKMRLYLLGYGKSAKNSAYRSEYWKRPKNRARRRENYAVISAEKKQAKAAMMTPEYLQNKKEEKAARVRASDKARYQIPNVRIAKICRARVLDAIRQACARKLSKSIILLGCSFDHFRKWLEAKWERGMSWMNYGHFWQIDHSIPVAAFDLTTLAGQLQCFRFTNCQPMWKELNQSKGDKMPDGQTRARNLKMQPAF